jgi:hypothetical protein
LTISIGLRAFIEAPSPQITKTNDQHKIPMSFQKQSSSAGKTQGKALEQLRAVSLIYLAANLDDPIYRRAIGKLSVIFEELESINATCMHPPQGGLGLRRYIE